MNMVQFAVLCALLSALMGCHKKSDGTESPSTDDTSDDDGRDTESGTAAAVDGSATDTGSLDTGPACDFVFEGIPSDLPTYDAGDRPEYDAGDAAFGEIFDAEALPSFYFTLSETAMANLKTSPGAYQPGGFRYVSGDQSEEKTLENVGVRLKGNWSFLPIDEKAAFKIKFDELVEGQRFKGLRRLTLNNLYQDPSAVRERLAYIVYREAGVTASLCNSARVYLNGEYYGLYTNVQSLDESFLEQHFAVPPDGNLYDTVIKPDDSSQVDLIAEDIAYFDPETNQDSSDLEALIDLLAGPQNTFYEDVRQVIDMDAFLTLAAVQAVIADWDSYSGNSNNYKLYHDLETDRFLFFPWGTDQTFNIWGYNTDTLDFNYDKLNYPIDHDRPTAHRGVLFEKCAADVECYSNYLAKVVEVVDIFDGLDLDAVLNGILNQVVPSVYEDIRLQCTGRHTIAQFEESVAVVREFIRERGRIVREQLGAQ